MNVLILEGLSKSYDEVIGLPPISCACEKGTTTAVCGPSGAGKTTALLVVAGLLAPSSGVVMEDGVTVNSLERTTLPHKRSIGFVFQAPTLWPHMSAQAHLEFVLRSRRVPKCEARERAVTLLKQLGMEELARCKPAKLSGGQQQRVNIARAIVASPKLLCLDEPMNHLDGALRATVWSLIEEQRNRGAVVLIAAHDPAEIPLKVDQVVSVL